MESQSSVGNLIGVTPNETNIRLPRAFIDAHCESRLGS